MSGSPTPETDEIKILLENLDEWIDESLQNSKPIGLTLCNARSTIASQHDRITELWNALELVRLERDEARREREEAISKLKFAQNELFTILRFQEDEKREHRNLLERLSFFQNRFESMRAERDQAMSDLKELREEQKEEAK